MDCECKKSCRKRSCCSAIVVTLALILGFIVTLVLGAIFSLVILLNLIPIIIIASIVLVFLIVAIVWCLCIRRNC